ncbi:MULTISPECIES: hypothetical protein [Bacteria]|uniref:hypothetical protein n=1 Tax=Bacteria TaxID=2 RepID=UPI0007343B73|nr:MULTISPECIES: hypothetical protein [Bacteria]
MTTPIIVGNQWSSEDGIYSDFRVEPSEGVDILLGYYDCEDYSGEAFVLFRKDGQLFEVNGSHCSCYGLEDQWNPEETNVEVLRHRLTVGSMGRNNDNDNLYADELLALIELL